MAYFLRKLKTTPQRILIARTDRIGDFILSLPVFEALKKELQVHITVLCNETVVPLLKNNPYPDETISIENPFVSDHVKKEIQSRHFDTLLVLVNDPVIVSLLPSLHQIPVRIGPLSKPAVFLHYTHPVIQKRSRSLKNEAGYNLELLKIFNLNNQSHLKPRLYLSTDEVQAFRSTYPDLIPAWEDIRRIIVLHQGMSGSALNMTKPFYFSLVRSLLEKGYFVFLTGVGGEEAAQNENLYQATTPSLQARLMNLSNRFDLRSLAILISQADAFIGPSTGPTHLANAVGTPLITFYPPIRVQSAKRWGPYLAKGQVFIPDVVCPQKYRCIGTKCPHYFCMDSIHVEAVIERLNALLASSSTANKAI